MAFISKTVLDESVSIAATGVEDLIESDGNYIEWVITNNGENSAMIRFGSNATSTEGHLLAAGESVSKKMLRLSYEGKVTGYSEAGTTLYVSKFQEV